MSAFGLVEWLLVGADIFALVAIFYVMYREIKLWRIK